MKSKIFLRTGTILAAITLLLFLTLPHGPGQTATFRWRATYLAAIVTACLWFLSTLTGLLLWLRRK